MPRDKLTDAERDQLRILVERRGLRAVLDEAEALQGQRRGRGRPDWMTQQGVPDIRWALVQMGWTRGLSVSKAAMEVATGPGRNGSASTLRADHAKIEKRRCSDPAFRAKTDRLLAAAFYSEYIDDLTDEEFARLYPEVVEEYERLYGSDNEGDGK